MNNPMSEQERKLDAAEYVIGTLSSVERVAFEASIESDASTKADLHFWERVFGSLNASVAPEAPDEKVWDRIEKELQEMETSPLAQSVTTPSQSMASAANDNILQKMARSRSRWRFGAIAATVAALGLGAYIYNNNLIPTVDQPAQQATVLDGKGYVAVVNANGDQPSLIVNVDGKTGFVTVRSVGVSRPDGKSLEVWYVPQGEKGVSVGLVGESNIDLKNVTVKPGDLFAVSLEPQGGSPTDTATGPVLYTGKLIEDTEPR